LETGKRRPRCELWVVIKAFPLRPYRQTQRHGLGPARFGKTEPRGGESEGKILKKNGKKVHVAPVKKN